MPIDVYRNDDIYNMVAEGEIAEILSKFNTSYVMDVIDSTIKNRFAFNPTLNNPNIVNSYELNFDLENVECLIENDYEYILYKGKLYHLNNKEQSLIEDLIENNLDKLLITKDKVDTFTKGLLGIVRKNLKIIVFL